MILILGPIPPGGSFTYTFRATRYGNSWYHQIANSGFGMGIFMNCIMSRRMRGMRRPSILRNGFLLGVGIRVCPRRDCKVSGCIFGVAGELDDILMRRLIDLSGSTRDGMNSNSVWLRCYIHAVKFIIRHSQCRYRNITRSCYSLLERCDFK
jgi:hypothetical protein